MITKPILVVDDEAIVRESIRDWLKDAGYRVEVASNGEQALEMAKQQDFGVVVMDIRLPGKTGMMVLRELKALKPEIKSVVITAYPTEDFVAEAKRLGAIDFLTKPIAPDDMEKLIRETLLKL